MGPMITSLRLWVELSVLVNVIYMWQMDLNLSLQSRVFCKFIYFLFKALPCRFRGYLLSVITGDTHKLYQHPRTSQGSDRPPLRCPLVTQLCPTLCDPLDCIPPGSSIHGNFQARVLEWGAIAIVGCNFFLQGIFPTQSEPRSPALQADSLPSEPPGKPTKCHVSQHQIFSGA